MKKSIEELLIYKLEDKIASKFNETIELSFNIIEGYIFSFINHDKTATEKNNLNLEANDLSNLYLKLYELLKEKYVDSSNKKINIFKIKKIGTENYFLKISIEDINHKTIIEINLTNNGNKNQVLENIEFDWLNLINEKKSSKIK